MEPTYTLDFVSPLWAQSGRLRQKVGQSGLRAGMRMSVIRAFGHVEQEGRMGALILIKLYAGEPCYALRHRIGGLVWKI